jgi:hypothetical protein
LQAKPEEHLLGSSEIIESVLGKLKRLEQNQAKSGFTGLVLSVAAVVSQTTREVVQQAMETVPTKKFSNGSESTLGNRFRRNAKLLFRTPRTRNKYGISYSTSSELIFISPV